MVNKTDTDNSLPEPGEHLSDQDQCQVKSLLKEYQRLLRAESDKTSAALSIKIELEQLILYIHLHECQHKLPGERGEGFVGNWFDRTV